MNADVIRGKWQRLRGRIREQWGRLTADDLDLIAGKRDRLIGRIRELYGMARKEAELQVRKFERSCE